VLGYFILPHPVVVESAVKHR